MQVNSILESPIITVSNPQLHEYYTGKGSGHKTLTVSKKSIPMTCRQLCMHLEKLVDIKQSMIYSTSKKLNEYQYSERGRENWA